MSDKKFSYYQFRKELGYQVYLRFEDFDFENLLTELLDLMGFDKIEREEVKDISFHPKSTRLLKIVKASPRVSRQINRVDYAFDMYGPESFTQMGKYEVYRYKQVGMMILGDGNYLWELGLKSTEDQSAIRMILTRFLSFALASQGVIGFWGVPIEEGFVVMSPREANFESVFVDLNKNKLLTYDKVKNIEPELQILRLSPVIRNELRQMSIENLFSFLTMNTTHLTYGGFEVSVRDAILELSQVASGYIYPEENFKPRFNVEPSNE